MFPLECAMLGYLGPDMMLPLTSTIAAGIGAVLLFGRSILASGQRMLRGVVRWVMPRRD